MAEKLSPESMSVGFIALGCPKNMVDSERMLAQIAQEGFIITTNIEEADVVVINTCGFIAPAKTEAVEAIKQAVCYKTSGTVKKVVVAGCLPERLGTELFDEAEGIDAIVGLGQRDAIGRIIKETMQSGEGRAFLGRSRRFWTADDRVRFRIGPSHWAYLRISEGCNHRCCFCTIPAIRGRFRSKPQKLILAEAAELASAGVVELNIIAQDSTYWGQDLKIKNGLARLLRELEKIRDLRWIRLMYLYPAGVDDVLIEAVAESEKVVHYFDIPIQHINDKILRQMRRVDNKERICRLIEKLRSAISDCVLRTTVIVGFPGETERQFNELLDFIRWAGFDALGCFRFYPESGTAAAEMPAQVPDNIKQQRFEELMLTQQKVAFAKNKSRIGTELVCLVDSVDSKGVRRGRFYGQAPEIDSVCLVKNCSASPGEFLSARVIDTKDYDLVLGQV